MRPNLGLLDFAVEIHASVIGLSGKFRCNRCFGIFTVVVPICGNSVATNTIDVESIL